MKRVLLLLLLLVPAAAGAQVCDVYNIEGAGETPAFAVSGFSIEPGSTPPSGVVRLTAEIEMMKRGNLSVVFVRRAGEEVLYAGDAEPGATLRLSRMFIAPGRAGEYSALLRVLHNSTDECTEAYVSAPLRVLSKPPEPGVLLTSPRDGELVLIQRGVLVDGLVPPRANVSVLVNGSAIGNSLPVLWKPEAVGSYVLTLQVSLGGKNRSDSVSVQVVNTSGAGFVALPEPVLRVHAAGTKVLAVTGRNAYLVDSSGRAVKLTSFSTAPLSTTHSSMLLLAEGSTLYLYNGSRLSWKRMVAVQPEMIALSHAGIAVVSGGRLYIHDTRGVLLQIIELGHAPELFGASDELVAVASRDSVAAYSYSGALLWNTSLYTRIYDMQVVGGEVYLLLQGRVVKLGNETPVDVLSFQGDMNNLSVSRKGVLLTSPTKAVLYSRDGELRAWLSSDGGIAGGVVNAAGKAVVLVNGRLAVLEAVQKPPFRVPLLPIALALSIAAVSGAGVLLWKRQRQKRRMERVRLRTARVAKSIKLESTAAVDGITDRLKREVEGAYHRVQKLDPCLPAYFRGAALQIIEAVHSAGDISLRHSLSRAAEVAVPLLCDAMEDWKNMEVYSSEPASGECSPPGFRMRDRLTAEEVEKRLAEVDREIANALGYLSTAPPASLWRVAMKVTKAAEGEKARQGYYQVAMYLLECVEHMLSEGELSRRLKR